MNVREITIDEKIYSKVLELRYDLFFKEYGLPRNILFDNYEENSHHIIGENIEILIAYGRLTNLGNHIFRISQMVVNPKYQHKGYGTEILRSLLSLVKCSGGNRVVLNARIDSMTLYKNQGFVTEGDVFLSQTTGVPHINMYSTLSNM